MVNRVTRISLMAANLGTFIVLFAAIPESTCAQSAWSNTGEVTIDLDALDEAPRIGAPQSPNQSNQLQMPDDRRPMSQFHLRLQPEWGGGYQGQGNERRLPDNREALNLPSSRLRSEGMPAPVQRPELAGIPPPILSPLETKSAATGAEIKQRDINQSSPTAHLQSAEEAKGIAGTDHEPSESRSLGGDGNKDGIAPDAETDPKGANTSSSVSHPSVPAPVATAQQASSSLESASAVSDDASVTESRAPSETTAPAPVPAQRSDVAATDPVGQPDGVSTQDDTREAGRATAGDKHAAVVADDPASDDPSSEIEAREQTTISTLTSETLSIPFEADETSLPADAELRLTQLTQDIRDKEQLRIQLLAYAGDQGTSQSKARRRSLSRALEVRKFLLDSGIKTSRIDVRALGNKSTEGSPDRVDVQVVER